jgi:hypothetical protein
MYAWLCCFVPPRAAEILTGLWYLLLVLLVAAFAAQPAAEFRYLGL